MSFFMAHQPYTRGGSGAKTVDVPPDGFCTAGSARRVLHGGFCTAGSAQSALFIALADIPVDHSIANWKIGPHAAGHFAGTRIGAPLSFTKTTRNLAGAVLLAFRLTMCTSSGPS